MAGLRRLLEEDLKLEKFSLDPYKKLISQQLEEVIDLSPESVIQASKVCFVRCLTLCIFVKVLKSSEDSKPANSAKKIVKKKPDAKASKKVSSEESSDASEEDEEHEDEIKPRKRSISKGKLQNFREPKKRKGSPKDTESSAKKRTKSAKKASEDSRDAEDPEDSEDDQSQSSTEKIVKVTLIII